MASLEYAPDSSAAIAARTAMIAVDSDSHVIHGDPSCACSACSSASSSFSLSSCVSNPSSGISITSPAPRLISESRDGVMKTILHVDMDAFYASVEQRDDPGLRGKPVIVGGRSRRGVVLAASYAVRPFGVRSAMPMAEALRRAPRAIVVPPRHDRYQHASEQAFAIFRRYTP